MSMSKLVIILPKLALFWALRRFERKKRTISTVYRSFIVIASKHSLRGNLVSSLRAVGVAIPLRLLRYRS